MKIVSSNYFYEEFEKHIINVFDFKKVEKAMQVLNWGWYEIGPPKSPSIERMMAVCKQIMKESYNRSNRFKKEQYCATGGFKSTSYFDEKIGRVTIMELEFILASSAYFETEKDY